MNSRILAATILMGLSAMAGAATPEAIAGGPKLAVTKGTVLVNDGARFVTAKPGQVLKMGDRVMVMSGGGATLTYPNGSVSAVPAGSLYSVGFAAPATQTALPIQKIGSMYAQAVGDTDDSRRCKDQDQDGHDKDQHNKDQDDRRIRCAAPWPADGHAAIGIGAGLVAVGLIIALNSSGGGNHQEQPISQP